MKLKRHSKPTRSKAILLLLVFGCAFSMVRIGSFKEQKAQHKVRTKALVNSAPAEVVKVAPKVANLPKVETLIEVAKITKPLAPVPAPQKRLTAQKRAQKPSQTKVKEQALNKLIEVELAALDANTDALDIRGPVEDLISDGFEESLSENENLFAATGNKKSLASLPPAETEMHLSEGTFKQNNFIEIKNALEVIKEKEKTLLSDLENKQEEKNILVAKKTAPQQPQAQTNTVIENRSREAETEPAQTTPSNMDGGVISNPKEQPKEQNEGEEEEEPTLAAPPKRKLNLSPVQASAGPELMSNQFIPNSIYTHLEPIVNTQTSVATQTKEVVNHATSRNLIPSPPVPPTPPGPSKQEKLSGTLYVDSTLDKWLITNKGHIELYLHQYGSPNVDDTIKLSDYRYPEREFKQDTSKLEGKYQLVAAVFSNSGRAPYTQIVYPKAVSHENFGERVSFYLKMQEGVKPPDRGAPVLNITVFEAASGNYRQAKPIEGAEVYIVGLEAMGKFKSDKEGNVRLANIPLHSELLMDVSAKDYYPTRKIVPIMSSSAYSTVNLIERHKVETVTGFFTKKAQEEKKALIFGRVYEPENRRPLSEDEVFLSNRKGHALYFNALPDTRLTTTTPTGLFAFLNVEPAFRTIFRSKSAHAMPMQLLPGYGYYSEPGRGGKKSLKAIVTDPVLNQTVQGVANTIGSNKTAAETDDSGNFEIKDVDLPTGNVTVEFRSKDYPVTWYTLPWDTRETPKTKKLYILEKELLYESAMSFAKVRPEKHKGMVVGGADPELFKGSNRCVRVELLNHNGQNLEEEKGPYLLYQRSHPRDNFCLTKAQPGFAFYNLDSGEYILNWKNAAGKVLSSQIVRVGTDRLSIVVR